MRRLRWRLRSFATAIVILVTTAASVAAAAEPAAAAPAPPPPVPSPSPSPSSSPAPSLAPSGDAEAAAALRATQELESRLIQISAELGGLEKERASWEDIRRRLDELAARVDALSRDLNATVARVEAPASAPLSSPPPARAARDPMGFGRRGGVVLRSDDGAFLLRPRLFLQVRYEGALVERGPGELSAPDRSAFLLRRAEVMVEGHVWSPRFEYRLQLDFAEPLLVKDAFVQWRFMPAVAVRAGQFKVPFGFQRQLLSAYYEFTDLSEAMSAFSLERDVGVMIVGRPLGDRLSYQVAVTNGAGQGKTNDNLDLAYSVRVVAAPFGPLPEWEGNFGGHARPLLAIGGSAHYNLVPTDVRARTGDPNAVVDVNGDGRVDNVAVWQGGVELRALWRGASVQAEYFQRHEHPGAAAADRDSWGAYAQAGYFVIPRFLQVAARVGRTDLPLYGVALAERQLRGDRVDEQTGAVSAYLRGHEVKIQVDYSHLRTRDVIAPGGAFSPDAHRVRAQAQLMF